MKKLMAVIVAIMLVFSNGLLTFAEDNYETVKEITFDDAKGLTGYTGVWGGDEKNYTFTATDVPIADGALKPNATSGAIVDGTFDGSKGFRITATVVLPEIAANPNPAWCRSIATIIDATTLGTLVVGEAVTGVDFTAYSINGNGDGTGFQAHADKAGVDDTWGGDGAAVAMGQTHVVVMTVLPSEDGDTTTVTMTVDGTDYVLPNVVSETGSTNHIDNFPNYLSEKMIILVGNTMYGDAYQYDILEVKVEKVVEGGVTETEQNKDGEKETTAETANKDGVPETADVSGAGTLLMLAVVSVVTVVYMTRKETIE